MRRMCLLVPLVAALALLAGCNGDGNASLGERVQELEAENAELARKVEQLTHELRPLEHRLNQLDQTNRTLEKNLALAEQDLRSRIHEMVQTERGGRRPFVRPAPAVAEVPKRPEKPKPYMGFDGQTITEEVAKELKLKAAKGVLVTAVREGGPADVAGLKKDDVVLTLDGVAVTTKTELIASLLKMEPGAVVVLGILRGDAKQDVKVKLGRR